MRIAAAVGPSIARPRIRRLPRQGRHRRADPHIGNSRPADAGRLLLRVVLWGAGGTPCGGTPSVSGGRYTPLPPPPCGARKTLRTFVCLRFSTAAEIPASLLNALPHLPFPGLFHDGPPTARLRRFRSRFFCHRQRVTGILPLAARSRNSPGGGGKIRRRHTQDPFQGRQSGTHYKFLATKEP